MDTVALESTAVYWIAVYEALEQRGLKVWLVDARQMKYVPGGKSDVQDCQWLHKLTGLGLLRAAWRPPGEVCVVRAVARQREVLIKEEASWAKRMQKALVQMNIRLTEVLGERGRARVDLGRASKAGSKSRVEFDQHRSLANRALQVLKVAAMSLSRSDSAVGACYRRLSGRMDKPRAYIATAHKLARMVYFMLAHGAQFVDQGRQRYEDGQRQRSIAALKRRGAVPGFQLDSTTVAARAATSRKPCFVS